MLAEDPHKVPHDKIKDIEIIRTVAGGRTTYVGWRLSTGTAAAGAAF